MAATILDPAKAIQTILTGVAGLAGVTVSVNRMPDTPGLHVCAYNVGGVDPNPRDLLDYPEVQVLVRGVPNGYDAAWAAAVYVKNALLGLNSQLISDDKWDAVNMRGDINNLGYDTQNRPCFSLNFKCIIEPGNDQTSNRTPLP